MEAVQEILQFLDLNTRIDLKGTALESILGLTASEEGANLLSNVKELFMLLVTIAEKDKSEAIRKDAALALINLSANKDVALKMTKLSDSDKLVNTLWSIIVNKVYPSADPACMILSNMTIEKVSCVNVYEILTKNKVSMSKIIDVLCNQDDSTGEEKEKSPKLHYLGPFVSNLSQLSGVREKLLADSCKLMSRLLPFTEYLTSSVRRGGVIGAVRNCCFDTTYHEMLLTDMDLLTRLLLPLAGPTPDTFDETEMETLPIDLQYLDEDKKIEEDADIRKLLLEALLQLCSTKKAREIIRDQNAYLILRELHKIESDETVKLACENVIDILIKKEDEIKFDNYKTVEVPEDLHEKFDKELELEKSEREKEMEKSEN